jgi:microcystin-dependent protein
VDCLALFTLIFNNLLDAWAPIFTSGGGATTRAAQTNAATAWAASCQIYLPQTLGRAWGFAGGGVGLTTRALGQALGEETHLLTAAEIPVITPTFAGVQRSWPSSQSSVAVNSGIFAVAAGGGSTSVFTLGSISPKIDTLVTPDGTISSFGSGAVHNNMQPTVFLNAMIKL